MNGNAQVWRNHGLNQSLLLHLVSKKPFKGFGLVWCAATPCIPLLYIGYEFSDWAVVIVADITQEAL